MVGVVKKGPCTISYNKSLDIEQVIYFILCYDDICAEDGLYVALVEYIILLSIIYAMNVSFWIISICMRYLSSPCLLWDCA